MKEVLLIVVILIIALALLGIIYLMLNFFSKQNAKQFQFLAEEQALLREKMMMENTAKAKKVSVPLKFQAYERMILFLERINPPNLITRFMKSRQTVATLQSGLLATVREEFEHNMSQQLYVTNGSWELVKAAKEDVMRLINTTSGNFDSTADAGDFAKEIITKGFNEKANPIDKAIDSLKNDIRNNFL